MVKVKKTWTRMAIAVICFMVAFAMMPITAGAAAKTANIYVSIADQGSFAKAKNGKRVTYTCTVAETEDLGRRDYVNLKAYADRIRPLAKKEKKGTSIDSQTLAKGGMVSAFGEVQTLNLP